MLDEQGSPASRRVRVLPDVSGIDRAFDYLAPDRLGELEPGTIVRVPLGPRRVRGWVLEQATDKPAREKPLREVLAVASLGPAPDVVELARRTAARYVGRLRPLLVAASPPRNLGQDEPFETPRLAGASSDERPFELRRLAPCASRLSVVEEVIDERRAGQVLVLVPNGHDAQLLSQLLTRRGHDVARYPGEWQAARAGASVVIGMRSAVFASLVDLSAIVVLDAHEEAFVEERAPTYSAVVVAELRAAALGARLVLTSPCPTLELLARYDESRRALIEEAADWPAIEVLDRHGEDPRAGLYGERLASVIRHALDEEQDRPVVAVLNRSGRVRRLACANCKELVVCEHCGAALSEAQNRKSSEAALLSCPSCGASRPKVCASCGSTRLKALRVGVQRVAEELEALVRVPVHLVAKDEPVPSGARLVVGTEAVLYRVRRASLVVFLDFDQELLAPRFRAGEEALALLALAGRLTGPRRFGVSRRVVVQTRLSGHEVIDAARKGDPDRFYGPERTRREQLKLPPARALALLSGDRVGEYLDLLSSAAFDGLEIATLLDGRAVVRAGSSEALAGFLSAIGLPASGVRVELDPLRI